MEIDISGIDKAELLAALVNDTRPKGMGRIQAHGTAAFTIEQARMVIVATDDRDLYFDYVAGRPVKTAIGRDTADGLLYDRDAGEGAFAHVVASLRQLEHPAIQILVDAEQVVALQKTQKRHRWNNGNACLDCGLRREGAGAGPYGAMRYFRDDAVGGASYKPGPCPSASETEDAVVVREKDAVK